MQSGVIYIISQRQEYVGLLLTSAASLKRVMPNVPITVFSQFQVQSGLFEQVIPIQGTSDGFYDKTKWIKESPYDRTIFLDADTFMVKPVPELFQLLDHFDIAATHEEYHSTDWFNRYPIPGIPDAYPEFNTGVLVFAASDSTRRFLQNWERLYQKFSKEFPDKIINDQPFFREAMYFGDLRMATLTRDYNCKFRGQGYLKGDVKILHGHHKLTLDESYLAKVTGALNASPKPRVYIAGHVYDQHITGRLVGKRNARKIGRFPEPPESITRLRLDYLRQILRNEGFFNVVSRVFGLNRNS